LCGCLFCCWGWGYQDSTELVLDLFFVFLFGRPALITEIADGPLIAGHLSVEAIIADSAPYPIFFFTPVNGSFHALPPYRVIRSTVQLDILVNREAVVPTHSSILTHPHQTLDIAGCILIPSERFGLSVHEPDNEMPIREVPKVLVHFHTRIRPLKCRQTIAS
jgi:hypothetical protein